MLTRANFQGTNLFIATAIMNGNSNFLYISCFCLKFIAIRHSLFCIELVKFNHELTDPLENVKGLIRCIFCRTRPSKLKNNRALHHKIKEDERNKKKFKSFKE